MFYYFFCLFLLSFMIMISSYWDRYTPQHNRVLKNDLAYISLQKSKIVFSECSFVMWPVCVSLFQKWASRHQWIWCAVTRLTWSRPSVTAGPASSTWRPDRWSWSWSRRPPGNPVIFPHINISNLRTFATVFSHFT